MRNEDWIRPRLEALHAQHLERRLTVWPDAGGAHAPSGAARRLNFAGNDYLNLAADPRVVAAAAEALHRYGAGSRASRLVSGTLELHERLEQRLAQLKGYPAALVFGSGFLANAGLAPALVGRDDLILADRLAHASLLDAATLSRARLLRFHHNDAAHLDALLHRTPGPARRLVLTESVFSMDGDIAPLAALAEVVRRHDALLLVDEAHATGVFGPGGSGLVRAAGVEASVNLSMGTLSKALGGYGGFVACSELMRRWLVNSSRAFIYTTAPPPAVLGAALGALDVLAAQPDLGAELLRRAAHFRARLHALGFDTMQSASQIVPIRIGDNAKALALAERLRAAGILAVAIRPPTVPPNSARLRLSVSLAHSEADLDRAAEALAAAARAEGLR